MTSMSSNIKGEDLTSASCKSAQAIRCDFRGERDIIASKRSVTGTSGETPTWSEVRCPLTTSVGRNNPLYQA
ncbi:hypothetical protein AAFF_G00216890 [Aldrovandia affinis]|uniref:Uncharacterized protein n=1 Tax=Aldrovandia affinis TaxID=143900 RepID=A0AAD7RIY2_9TELE|nr:hypothetical protein AAFF_G00216890 [Aldrovandia affinis]